MNAFTTIVIILWTQLLESCVRQAYAHLTAALVQRSLRHLPGDRNTVPSPGLARYSICIIPGGFAIAPSREWEFAYKWSLFRYRHPVVAARRFEKVSVATASVHEVRLYLRTARRLFLSRHDKDVLDAVRKRAEDLRSWDDFSDDEGGGMDPTDVTPDPANREGKRAS